MKKISRNFGIIALTALIVFSMASCASIPLFGGSDGDDGGAYGAYSAAWPGNDVWAGYGLSGLQPPPGRDGYSVSTFMGTYMVAMAGARAEYDNLVTQIRGMSGVTEVVAESTNRDGTSIGFTTSTGHNVAVVVTSDRDSAVMVSVSQ